MTVMLRDASDFDESVSFGGLAGFTHKATEGISVVHSQYGPRLAAARSARVPVLGAYHVLRTPSAANGSLDAQLRYWVSYLDSQTPWWRTYPNWVMQIDVEKWPYDAVGASTALQFAALLAGSGLPGWKVTYASRGQYGDTLTGIGTPLWNADYRGSVNGSYPGDGWTRTAAGAPAGWAPYSGQTPVLLQFTSTPYDTNAYRGSLDELLTLTGGHPMAFLDDPDAAALSWRMDALHRGTDTVQGGPTAGEPMWLVQAVKDLQAHVGQPVPVEVDADAVAAALIANKDFMAAIAKSVNDDAKVRRETWE